MKLGFVGLGQMGRPIAMDLLRGAAGLSAELCIPMPVLAAATATYQAALLHGHGGQDKGAMVQVFEALPGVQVRSRPGPAAEAAA